MYTPAVCAELGPITQNRVTRLIIVSSIFASFISCRQSEQELVDGNKSVSEQSSALLKQKDLSEDIVERSANIYVPIRHSFALWGQCMKE